MVSLDKEAAAFDSTDLCCHGDRRWLCWFLSIQHVRWIVPGEGCGYLAAALGELSAKTEGVRCTTSIARLRADTLWSNDRVTFRFYSETAVFLLKTSSKTDKKTELSWDYRTAVIGKKLLHYHVLHLYFRHSVCHIHDIHIVLTSIIFFLYSRETTLRWHTIWFLNWSFLLNSGI